MGKQIKENSGSPSIESIIKRGYLFIEDSEWDKADEYFDKALDIDPEYAPAYIGKLCVELRVKNEEALGNYQELRQGKKFDRLLGEYGNFQKALRFADSGYLKKLNGYEQEIKEKFPKKIPQKFTDKFIKSEIARLEKEIANYDAEIAKGEQGYRFNQSEMNRVNKDYSEKENALKKEQVEKDREFLQRAKEVLDEKGRDIGGVFLNDAYIAAMDEMSLYGLTGLRRPVIDNEVAKFHRKQQYENEISQLRELTDRALQRINEYKGKKAELEAEKKVNEILVGIPSCLDRMDFFYDRFVEAWKEGPPEDEYNEFAENFRSLEGYKDSKKLADECEKLAVKTKYDNLVQRKNKASSEDEYKQLAQEFRKMEAYENSAQLADECDKLAVKAKYYNLVQEKNNASSEDEYAQLARKFREMGSYENSTQLADECEKQIRVIKERIAEQQRQEDERKRREAAEWEVENARRLQQLIKEEDEENRKKIIKNIIGFMLTFVPFIVGLLLYGLGLYRIRLIELLIFPLLLTIPIVRIHFRDYSRTPSVVIFILGLLFFTYMIVSGNDFVFPYQGLLAMGLSFIMALAYPKYKYWKTLQRRCKQEASKYGIKRKPVNKEVIKKWLIGFLAVVVAIASVVLFITYRQTGSFFEFHKNDQGTFTVTGYSGRKEVVIPATKNGVSVTEIGDNAFDNQKITSVDIPNGVTVIGVNAFNGNLLTSVVLPNSVTMIGENAFSYNQLTGVEIPDSVTIIGKNAFSYNQLTSVTIPDSVTTIEQGAFMGNQLTDVVIGNKVTSIEAWVFAINLLTNITIPNSATSIGMSAFSDNKLTSVTIPNSVTVISLGAFAGNPVTNIRIGANVKLDSIGDTIGILGEKTGFNGAYDNNGKRAGTYTRADVSTTTWTRR